MLTHKHTCRISTFSTSGWSYCDRGEACRSWRHGNTKTTKHILEERTSLCALADIKHNPQIVKYTNSSEYAGLLMKLKTPRLHLINNTVFATLVQVQGELGQMCPILCNIYTVVDIFAWRSVVRTVLQYLHGKKTEETWSIRKIHSGTCPKQFNIRKRFFFF